MVAHNLPRVHKIDMPFRQRLSVTDNPQQLLNGISSVQWNPLVSGVKFRLLDSHKHQTKQFFLFCKIWPPELVTAQAWSLTDGEYTTALLRAHRMNRWMVATWLI